MARATVHVQGVDRSSAPGISRQSNQIVGDLSYRDQSFTLQTVQKYTRLDRRPHSTRTTRSELLLSGGVLALRENGKAWQCGRAANLTQGLGGLLPVPGLSLGAKVKFAPHATQQLGSITVWALRINIQRPILGGSTTGTVYIATSDQTIVEESETTRLTVRVRHGRVMQSVTSTATSTVTYSQYGEAISVNLPGACTTPPVTKKEWRD